MGESRRGLSSRLILDCGIIMKMTKTFEELGLSREFVNLLEKYKIETPSEIQEKTIPLAVAGKDIIGGSATGSGKTLAFASGIIENFEKTKEVQALVLTPTRELAEQVADSIRKFSSYKKLNVLAVYGGVKIDNQIFAMQKADIVVGTPGRILDHLNRRTLNLKSIKYLVLDEVDRMFDMGFQQDVEQIINECPKKRQTMLFSATISPDVDYLAKKHTSNAKEVSVISHVDPTKLKQIYYDVEDGLKFSLFVHLLKKEKANLVMVFCGTRRNVDFVTNNLRNLGINAKAIHGGMEQKKRGKVMDEFNSSKGINVLVCTDVAARGLDIKGVSHVYNYDLPKTSPEYIHRIGRTARAGKDGIAINILCSRDYENFNNVLKDKNLKIEELSTPRVERVRIIVDNKKSRGSSGIRSFNQRNSDGRGRGSGKGKGDSFSRPRNSQYRGRQRDSRDNSGRRIQRNSQRPQDSRRNDSLGRNQRGSGARDRNSNPKRNDSRDNSGRNQRRDSRKTNDSRGRDNSGRRTQKRTNPGLRRGFDKR